MELLDSARRIAQDKLEEDLRNRIQDTVRSYRHFWDPLGELLQNSVDAINRRHGVLNDPEHYLYDQYRSQYEITPDLEYRGKIVIEMWPSEHRLRVTDNGVGIRKERITDILLPEGSDKKRGKEYGYKGKGLTYTAFVSRHFSLSTRFFCSDEANMIALDGLLDWLVSETNEAEFPNTPIPRVQPNTSLPADMNTQVEMILGTDYDVVFPAVASLNYFFKLAEDDQLDGLEVVLRTRTAVGNTRSLFGLQPIVPITVTVVVYPGGGKEPVSRIIPYKYYHPLENEDIFRFRSYSFDDYVGRLPQVNFTPSFRCLYFAKREVLVGTRSPVLCDFFVSSLSTTRLGNLNKALGLDHEGTKEAALTYGVYLAIDGMPTGIRVDSWDTKGHDLKRYLIIADASLDVSNELDAGRKGISKTRADQISKRAEDFRNYRVSYGSDGRQSDPFRSYSSKHLDWGRQDEVVIGMDDDFADRVDQALASAFQDKVDKPELLERLTAVSTLIKFPTCEDEVRALFHELLASSKLKGYRTVYAAGNQAVYDSALDYELKLEEGNLYPQDILGFSRTHARELRDVGVHVWTHRERYHRITLHPRLCVEFKLSIGQFLQEVIISPASSPKRAGDIDILVVWSDHIPPNIPEDTFTFGEIDGDRRIFHGVTHRLGVLSDGATDIWCIVLDRVIQQL